MKRLALAACAALITLVSVLGTAADAKARHHHRGQHAIQAQTAVGSSWGWAASSQQQAERPQRYRHGWHRRGHVSIGRLRIAAHHHHRSARALAAGPGASEGGSIVQKLLSTASHVIRAIERTPRELMRESGELANAMLRDLGTNPTGWRSQWCAVYLRQVLVRTGHSVSGTDARAISFLHYGKAVNGPTPGAIGVMKHHVFVVRRVLPNRRVEAISGNTRGRRVGIGTYSIDRVVAWRLAA